MNIYNLQNYLLNTTSLCTYSIYCARQVNSRGVKSLRDVFNDSWGDFYNHFGISDQVEFLAKHFDQGGSTDVERWRYFCRAVEQAYIDSFETTEERAEQQRIIDAGGGPFFAGYRKAVIDLWPEAWLSEADHWRIEIKP